MSPTATIFSGAQRYRRRRLVAAWVVYWCVLFVVTHIPPPRVGLRVPRGSDKVAHFVLYLGLSVIGGYAVRAARTFTSGRLIGWAVVYLVYAGLDEWLQSFVSRHMSLQDWLADAAGVLVGTGWHLWGMTRVRRSGVTPT